MILKKTRLLSAVDAFTVTVSYVITREKWFRVYFLHAENFLAFDQNYMKNSITVSVSFSAF